MATYIPRVEGLSTGPPGSGRHMFRVRLKNHHNTCTFIYVNVNTKQNPSLSYFGN